MKPLNAKSADRTDGEQPLRERNGNVEFVETKGANKMDETKIEKTLAAITGLNKEEINSIELSRTSKGEPSWKIKIYCKTGDEEKTITEIDRLDKKCKELFK